MSSIFKQNFTIPVKIWGFFNVRDDIGKIILITKKLAMIVLTDRFFLLQLRISKGGMSPFYFFFPLI